MLVKDWDALSHQPHVLPRAVKHAWRRQLPRELARCAVDLLRWLPLLPCAWQLSQASSGLWQAPPQNRRRFAGLALGLDEADPEDYAAVLEDLDCHHLLLRIPAWQSQSLEPYLRLLRRFPDRDWVVSIMQDRDCVRDPQRWAEALARIIGTCRPYSRWFQIGQAPNRIKWGCAHAGDYRRLFAAAQELRRHDSSLRLAGPGVLDFEPLALAACLTPSFQPDAITLGLYVDRRGAPEQRQLGVFDLNRKIQAMAAIALACGQRRRRLWINEVNWPLAGVGAYAPAGPEVQVDETTYAQYLRDYLDIAYRSGIVERVYWWQPIATGYGLIDGRDGRRRPAYKALRDWLAGN